MAADIVDGENVGMIQRADNTGFLFEPAKAVAILGERLREDLYRNFAAQARIARAIDLSHAARAQQ